MSNRVLYSSGIVGLLGPSVSYSSLSLPLSPVAIKEITLSTLNTQTHKHLVVPTFVAALLLVVSTSLPRFSSNVLETI